MPLDKPTNSKAYARHFLKHVFLAVRDSKRVMPPTEYKDLAAKIGLRDDQLSTALQELKYDNLIALDSTTQGIRLTPQGVHEGDYLHQRPLLPLLRDPLPESLEEVRLEIRYFAKERSANLPGTPEWDWANGRLDDLRHSESMMLRDVGSTVYILSGQSARVNVNSTDNSVNTISISEADVFPRLRGEIEAKVTDALRRQQLLANLDELELSKSSSTYAEKFTNFISFSADVMTIVGPFLPLLAAFHSR